MVVILTKRRAHEVLSSAVAGNSLTKYRRLKSGCSGALVSSDNGLEGVTCCA